MFSIILTQHCVGGRVMVLVVLKLWVLPQLLNVSYLKIDNISLQTQFI